MTWDFNAEAQAHLNQYTHMIYYSSQLIEMDQQLRMLYLFYFSNILRGYFLFIQNRYSREKYIR